MAKEHEINIPVKTPGIEQANKDLDQTKKKVAEVGDQVQKTGQQTQQANEQTTQSSKKTASGFDLIGFAIKRLRSEVISLVSGWAIINAVIQIVVGIFDKFIERAQRANDAMRKFSDTSLGLREIGQRLEFQTGTVGKQKEWTQAALAVQKAGGLSDIQTAGNMMISADIAFSGQGGIKNPQIQSLVKQLAPFFGSAMIGSGEIAKVFDFSQTSGVGADLTSWMMYMAKLQAGFTASKATSFGSYMEGLQKGATPYMASGGSLDEAISLFSGARAVTANEALAGTMLEQMTRLSSGAYEKPRQAMEKSMGVRWESLSMDQRANTLIQYVSSLPESSRAQIMAEQGFGPELISSVSRVVSGAGMQTISATRQRVGGATPALVQSQMGAFKESQLGKSKETAAEGGSVAVETVTDPVARFMEELKSAETDFERRDIVGSNEFLIPDRLEPMVVMLENMKRNLDVGLGLSGEGLDEADQLSEDMQKTINSGYGTFVPRTVAGYKQAAFQLAQRYYDLEKKATSVNVVHNNNTYFNQTPPAASERSGGGIE